MFKPTPNPPQPDTEHTEAEPSAQQNYLNSSALKYADTPYKPESMFMIAPDIATETLLAHACESLASANVMANDLAGFITGPYRNALLGIAQIIMLAELAVNRALDNIEPQE
ncbi:DUF6124 family protein [Pseudomonas sp. LB3P31]